jgi:CheY-like chemotaxis protein
MPGVAMNDAQLPAARKILVVDDENSVCKLIGIALGRSGYEGLRHLSSWRLPIVTPVAP